MKKTEKTSKQMVKKSNESSSPSKIKVYSSHPLFLIKSGFLMITWMIMGFHLELVGPTMPILANITKVDFSGMGSALAARSFGYLTGNILGVAFQHIVKYHSDGLLVCGFILPAIVVFATPFVKSLTVLSIIYFLQGLAQSFTDLGGTNLLLTMWGSNAAAPMNIVHLGYGIGAVLVNLLVRPFISPKVQTNNSTLTSVDLNQSNIVLPYSITAILCFLTALGHIIFYIKELRTQRQNLSVRQAAYAVVNTNPGHISHTYDKETTGYSPRTCGRGYFNYGLILSIIFILYIFFIGANEQTFSKFFFTYLKSTKFNLSTEAASFGIILYWLSYSIGRLLAAILSVVLSVTICLNIVWFGGLCLITAWLIFVWYIGLTGTSLFVLGVATGLVFAPTFPLSFALFNQRLNVIPMLIASLLCGAALGAITMQKIAGIMIDRNPNQFPILLVICILMSIFFYIISNLVYLFHERTNLSKRRASITNGAALVPENLNEEQQMTEFLKCED